MKKLILSLILATFCGISAFAQTSVWDGTASSWTQGSGTEDDPYLIASAQNLAYIAEMVNGGVNQYSNKWFKLTTDIDLNNLDWTPIGGVSGSSYNNEYRFQGNFNGNSHIISNISVSGSGFTSGFGGLFGNVTGGVFQNINVDGMSCNGGLVAKAFGAINFDNCSILNINGGYGGFINETDGIVTFNNCICTITNSTKTCSYNGGFIGRARSSAVLNNCSCECSDSIIGTIYAGGLVGLCEGNLTVNNCTVSGGVVYGKGRYAGGIVGQCDGIITLINSTNSASVRSIGSIASVSYELHSYAGGLVGMSTNTLTITNCNNSGDVLATRTGYIHRTDTINHNYSTKTYAGGVVGYMINGDITLCTNIGNIEASTSPSPSVSVGENGPSPSWNSTIKHYSYAYSGGIVGWSNASSAEQTAISLCYNKGTILSTARNSYDTYKAYSYTYTYSGGILGRGNSMKSNCYNRGDVTARSEMPSGAYSNAYEYASGISYPGNITNCYNTGTLTTPTDKCSHTYKFGIGNGSTTTTNCYYLETCGGSSYGATSKTEEAMKSESFPILLNPEAYIMDLNPNVNDGYPIFGLSVCNITTEPVTNLNFYSATLNGRYEAGEYWQGSLDMQGFEWKAASAQEWTTVYTNVGTPALYDLTGLEIGTDYQYRMFVKIGESTIYGNTVDFTTRACDAAVSVTTENATICDNVTTALTATPSSSGSISSCVWSTGGNGTDITVNAAGTYTVTVTDEFNCTAMGSIDIATITAPQATISGNTYICTGSSTTLTAHGGVGYVWNTGATTPMITVSEVGPYSVIARASNGCTDTVYVNVENFNEVVISGNTSICTGESTTLTVSEGTSYLWSTGATTQSINVTSEGLYSVTVTNSQCEANTSVYVTVNALPTPAITGVTAICGGASTTLTASGGTEYAWSNGATTPSIEVSTSGNYRVTVTNANGCAASASTSVVSAPNPSVQITGNTTACAGTQITLTATGGTEYSWSNSANTAAINPTQSGTYTVTAYNALGCSATASAIVTINPNPQLNITAPHTICNNASTTLEVSDNLGSTITSCVWSNGGSGNTIQVSPTATTNYTVTVTNNNGCMAQASTSVIVAEQLSLAVSGNTSICGNESAELTVSGIAPANVSSYAWSNGANTASVYVSAAGTYSVIVTDVNGCTGYATTNVIVSENPTAAISGNLSVCSGNSTTLVANGGTSYQWDNGSTDASISVTAGGTYTVVVANGAGCTATASAIVTVNESPMPQISGELAMCEGSNTTLTVNGGDSFVWSNGSTNASVNVTNAGTYTVIASNANGCTASASAVVSFMENPLVTISGNPSICAGGATTLTAEGGNSYLWSTGFPGASINVNAAGTYSVIATGANGCTSSASLTVAQYSAPEVSITGNTTVCEGSSTTITANGGVSYQWSTGETGASISVNAFGIYSVTATGNGGCTATANATVFVASAPTPSISGNLHICDNEATTLTANGGDSYMWSNGSTGNSINVTNGGTYSVIATNASGCTAMASANVEAGYSVTNSITETAETEYIWNGQTYTATGDYTQSFIAANGCDSIVTLHLTITGGQQVQHYNIFVVSSNNAYGTVTGTGVYEENEVVTITATANEGYEFLSWNDGNTESIRQIVVTGDATYIATFIPATGIEENVALEINVFPNPATDILNITSSETISEIEIVNVMGQVVRRVEVNSDNVVCDVEDLTSGVYVVRIRTASATLSQQRFVKE